VPQPTSKTRDPVNGRGEQLDHLWIHTTVQAILIRYRAVVGLSHCARPAYSPGAKFNAVPLMQYRRPVGGGPSLKT
jgi:hypothetical protein